MINVVNQGTSNRSDSPTARPTACLPAALLGHLTQFWVMSPTQSILLEAVAKRIAADAKTLRRTRLIPFALPKRLLDHGPLPPVEIHPGRRKRRAVRRGRVLHA